MHNFLKIIEKNNFFLFLLIISIFFLNTFYGLENGGDAYLKIFFSENIHQIKNNKEFLDFINSSHHLSRWSLILPLTLFTTFIKNPFVLNLIFSFFLFISSYCYLYKILPNENKNNYFLLLTLLIMLPFQSRFFSQPMTEYLSFISLLICMIYLVSNLKKKILLASIFFFISYGSKITNLYFLPGILIYLFFNSSKKDIINFLFILLIFFFFESLLFNWIFELDFGRAQHLLFGSHIQISKINYGYINYISTIYDKLFFSSDILKKNIYGIVIILFFLFNIFYTFSRKLKSFSILAFANVSYFIIYVFFALKINNNYIIIEPAGIPRHYFIFVNFTLFLIFEYLLFFLFKKTNYIKLIFLSGIFSIFIFSFFSTNNFKHKLNYNKLINSHEVLYFEKIKDKKMLIFMNEFYHLETDDIDIIKKTIIELDRDFIGCKKNLSKRPCLNDLRTKNIKYD